MTRRVVTPGLAPSASLAPSNSLAPADTIYGGAPITPHQFWASLSGNGTLTDISPYVEYGEGVTYTYGRQTQFDDTNPGTFTFTLNNQDGRFTPDNPYSPYPVTLAEGVSVAWVLSTRIVYGRVLTIEIPSNEEQWDQIVITCDDALGTAGRHSFTSIPDGLVARAGVKALWKLDEDSDQQFGVESFADPLGPFGLYRSNPASTTEAVTFGAEQAMGLPGTAVTVTAAPGETNWFGTRHGNTVLRTNITTPYLAAQTSNVSIPVGTWNMWVYPGSTINLAVVPVFGVENPGYAWSGQIQCTPTSYTVKPGTSAGFTYNMTAAEQLKPHYVSMRWSMVWQTSGNYYALYTALYVDAALKGTAYWYDPQHTTHVPAYQNSLAPVEVSVSVTTPSSATAALSGTVQRVSCTGTTQTTGLESLALVPTLDGRRNAADFIGDDINTAVYNGPLSTAPIGFPDDSGSTILDMLNDVARTEGGYLFAQTVGTLAAPYVYLEVRARDRPATVKAVFDVAADLSGPPTFVRDITNVAASVDVSGPSDTVTATDPTITGRYITTGAGETVLYSNRADLQLWGQDRLLRGKNRQVRAQQFTVDAASTPIDRTTDLIGLVPGDRIQLAGLPSTRLGFTTWDGWLLGASESHTPNSNSFTFTVTPTLPTTATYNTSLYASGGRLQLGNTYTASATSWVFNSLDPVSTTVPYTVLVDKEQVTVTAVTGSTWTVTRGVNGTSPAAHTVGAYMEIVPTALYAY